MLAKNERLGKRGVRTRVLRSGRFRFGSFKIVAGQPPKGAVIVSKKIAREAARRNRLRRRFAAILQTLARSGALSESVILYPNNASHSVSRTELAHELERVLRVR